MGSIIRLIFKTNFKYTLIDRFLILLCIIGILLWINILTQLLCQ